MPIDEENTTITEGQATTDNPPATGNPFADESPAPEVKETSNDVSVKTFAKINYDYTFGNSNDKSQALKVGGGVKFNFPNDLTLSTALFATTNSDNNNGVLAEIGINKGFYKNGNFGISVNNVNRMNVTQNGVSDLNKFYLKEYYNVDTEVGRLTLYAENGVKTNFSQNGVTSSIFVTPAASFTTRKFNGTNTFTAFVEMPCTIANNSGFSIGKPSGITFGAVYNF